MMKVYYLNGFRENIQYIKSLSNVVLVLRHIEYINYEEVEVFYYETKNLKQKI